MSAAFPTPGPWLVKPSAAYMHHNGDIGIVTAKGSLIAVALHERGHAALNARLIAEALPLLDIARRVEALFTAQRYTPDGIGEENALLRDARATLEKVAGATS